MRWRFGLLGEGETGSPRKRFRARETAVVDGDAFACEMAGNASGEGVGVGGRGFGLLFVGVANGFELGTCLFTGEKGLNPGRGGTWSAGRDFGAGIRALESFL